MLNSFDLYEQLLNIETVARQYQAGRACIPEIDRIQHAIATRQYRVAVIGEFKRGKSSLINALIGAEVLPTDILPMTAAITRVTFGAEQKILIRYKDGRAEEQTVEQLAEYATKYDEEKARRAASVSEIEVSYPAVICQNSIDVIDTPGLNDNETMTEVTLGVLGEVDAAIVVISATSPLSITEKQLILDLIGQRQIRHLVFAVTLIDLVSRRASEQDRILDSIRERIAGNVLSEARARFAGDPYFAAKAERILSQPDLFGVSSRLAMDGFIQNDLDLLEESRFPQFKSALQAMLTSAQSTDVAEKVRDMAQFVQENMEAWRQADDAALQAQKAALEQQIDQFKQYCATLPAYLEERLRQFSKAVQEQQIDMPTLCPLLHSAARQMFIDQLAQIWENTNTDEHIRAALTAALTQADAYIQQQTLQATQTVTRVMSAIANVYGEQRQSQGFDPKDMASDLQPWLSMEAPSFRWLESPIPAGNLKGINVITHIEKTIDLSIAAYKKATEDYLDTWRNILERRKQQDLANPTPLTLLQEQLEALEQQMTFLTIQHQNSLAQMESVCQKLK